MFSHYRKIELAAQHIDQRVKQGKAYEDAWNETSVELVSAADSHGRAFILQTYANTVASINTVSSELKTVLVKLQQLYTVHTALKCIGDLLRVISASLCSIQYLKCRFFSSLLVKETI